ncbi:MAG: M24 family metallopeptidase [Candidatus Gracilibacteria bacterium]
MNQPKSFPEELYSPHLEQVLAEHREAMEKEGVDLLVIGSGGSEVLHYDDDHGPSTPVAPNFVRLVPTKEKPNNHVVVVGTDGKPTLLFHSPMGNFWQKPATPPDNLNEAFDVREVPDLRALDEEVTRISVGRKVAHIGPRGPKDRDPEKLKARLEWARRFKTPFEIACIAEASRTAALGHIAAKDAFLAGGSELDMHLAFLGAAGATDDRMAFPSIVSLDADTAWLHRPEKDPGHSNGGRALIDAGTRFRGYNSDITTTWVREGAGVHAVYTRLLLGLEGIQKNLCTAIRPGVDFIGLHEKAHLEIAKLLLETGILKNCSPEEAVEKRFTTAFLPHGLGHPLGIQTHDKGGKQEAPEGGMLKPPSGDGEDPLYDWLRKLSPLAEREVVTIEPGIYFFQALLARFRTGEHSSNFDWPLIDQLDGGMRLESNVLVLANGFRDMTAEVLERKTNV